jgi:multiple sugar transport system substrate-binding protein
VSDEESTKWVRVSDDRLRRVTRRDLLKLTAAGAAGATLAGVERLTGPYIVHAQPRELRIMTWSHFVPAFDAWFDPFARAWGTSKNIRVTVDHVSFADIVPRATAEVAAQQGHDCYFFIAPPSQFEPQVLDLADINQEAERRYGPLVPFVRNSVYNPHTRKYFGFSDNWVPDPGDYLKSVWANVGYVNGPRTWDDLITAGQRIKQRHPEIQIPIGIGFSQDIDSNMATRAIMWSFGSSIQDQNSNVVLNSEETVKAVEYGVRLFREVMSPAVLSWNAASNNLALNARQTSYILNSISAYRSAQAQGLPVANDIFFTPALRGPARAQVATHVMGVWVIWRFSRAPDLAKEFLLHFLDNQRDAIMASRLYNFPSYWGSVADRDVPVAQKPEAGRRWIRSRVFQDPFGSLPPDKLKVLADSERWSTNVGFPGTANPAEGEIFDTYVITDMFAKAATGQLSPKAAVEEADRRVKEIFAKWRRAGLVGGGRDR